MVTEGMVWRATWELVADRRPIRTASAVSRNPWAHHATESASVLASVNVAPSPSSPCSTRVPRWGHGSVRGSGWLRALS